MRAYCRKHLSNDEVHAMVAPRSEHIRAVTDFIESHGATATAATPNSDMIRTTVPVELAEKMLSTSCCKLHNRELNSIKK